MKNFSSLYKIPPPSKLSVRTARAPAQREGERGRERERARRLGRAELWIQWRPRPEEPRAHSPRPTLSFARISSSRFFNCFSNCLLSSYAFLVELQSEHLYGVSWYAEAQFEDEHRCSCVSSHPLCASRRSPEYGEP